MLESVLIADDSPYVVKVIAAIATDCCSDIDKVNNGRDLVEYALRKNYSVIFTDNEMPELDGLKAIVEIRKSNCAVPICMMSGSDVKDKALTAGANWYLEKPIDVPAVIEILEIVDKK